MSIANPDPGLASPIRGLTSAEARKRLVDNGPNELPSSQPHGPLDVLLGVLREPMLLLLFACGALYFAMGDPRDAILLLAFVLVVVAISFVQQRRTERALDALRQLSSPRALVLRDGRRVRIPGRDVVPGDVLLIREGDRVPADAILLEGVNLTIDESLLTGESVPVRKLASGRADSALGAPGGDDTPFLFSSTLAVQGRGTARVLATGMRTAVGAISRRLGDVTEEPSRVQRDTARAVRFFAVGGIAVSVGVALAYAITRGDWWNGVLAGLTTAMALIPEELPVVLTVFLGLGAWRMARQRVLTRRIPAIEMLGAATVLCTDKTGTLTQNRMAVAKVWAPADDETAIDVGGELAERHHPLLEFATLAGHRDPFDPMEQAIVDLTRVRLADTEHMHPDWILVGEYPLAPDLKAMSRVWISPTGARSVVASKGAPEDVVDLCHLDERTAASVLAVANGMASAGLRVLGVARAYAAGSALPPRQHDFDFELVGLLGLADPLREQVPNAVAEARAAGVRVMMITGDYPATAMSIAAAAGIDGSAGYATGPDMEGLDDEALRRIVKTTNVFCRMVPEQKLRLVNALKANGETVAMTGDGVNDAPALKAAHIGIAMGERGTDVARESAALVLLDDDFQSIVAAIRLGRRIFDNLRNAVTFIAAVHVPIVGMSLLPVALGWPLLLMPVHVMFLQLIIDPVCSVVLEAEPAHADTMRRAPRPRDASLFGSRVVLLGLVQGAVLLAGVLLVDVLARSHLTAEQTRALTFTTLALGAIGLVFANRSGAARLRDVFALHNVALWAIAAAGVLLLAAIMALAPLRSAFHFGRLGPPEFVPVLAVVLLATALFVALRRRV